MTGGSRVDAATLAVLVIIVALVPVGLAMRLTVTPSDGAPGPAALPVMEPTPVLVGPLAPPWQPVSGDWTRAGEQIVHNDMELERPAVAVVFIGQDATVGVDVVRPRRGDGVVVRYVDPENYWMVFADPAAALWRVVKVVDGITIGVDAFAADFAVDNRVAVASVAGELTIDIDGETHSIIDAELSEAAIVGLISLDPTLGATEWSRFRAGAGVGFAGVEADDV